MEMKKQNLVWLPLNQISPFDYHHFSSATNTWGWVVRGEGKTEEHLNGIEHARQCLWRGEKLRPIAVCPMDKVPVENRWRPDSTKRWQRLDGFKRFMATRAEGREMILCEVIDYYSPGYQHGFSMTVEDKEVGNIRHRLAADKIDPAKLPFAERISIEDCETVHVHLGNMRLEYNRKQFLQLADKVSEAAATLRAKIANKE
jgi:hypothetical protein